jgi:hypothetical protein
MSTEYHKIHAPFKRDMTPGPNKGKLIMGDWALPELKYLADNEWEFTEKVDGTNIRVELSLSAGTPKEATLYVTYRGRTDNAQIPTHLLLWLEENFPTYGPWRRDLFRPAFTDSYELVKQWMLDNGLTDVVLYGEGYGPKIQGGGKYREDVSFVLFDVKIGDFWLDRENVNDVADKLGIDSVPVVGRGTLWDAIQKVSRHSKEIANHVVWFDPMKSAWGDFEAEGIVARPVVPMFNRKGERILTKIKGVDFK